MTLVRHELKQGRNAFLIWTAAIGGLLAVCVFLFPEMKGEMEGVSDIFPLWAPLRRRLAWTG